MKRFSFTSLRVRLIILVLLAALPALGITLYSGIEQRGQERQRAFDDALGLAQHISETHARLIENARHILFTLSKTSEVQQQDKAACSKIFADIVKQSEGYTALVAAKPNGDVFASSIPITRPINYSDRPWFQRLLKTRDFVIGEYLIGRVSAKPIIVLAHPVFDGIGNLKVILAWGMDLEWLNKTLVKNRLQEGISVSVIDSDGKVLLRYPEPEKFVGKSMPEASIVKAVLAKDKGVEDTVGIGGVPRLFGFTSLGMGIESVHVTVGIPKQIALAKVDRVMKRNLVYLGLIALLALAAAWFMGGFFVIHPVNRLLETTKRIEEGDLTARTGPPYREREIGQLARAFDHMATSLEQRESERKQSEEELRLSESKFRNLAESLDYLIYRADPDTFMASYVNSSVEKFYGYTVDEWLQDPRLWETTLHPEDRERVFAKVAESRKSLKSMVVEYRIIRKNGAVRFVEDYATWELDLGGRPVSMNGVMRDITEHKQAEEELKLFRALIEHSNDTIEVVNPETGRFLDVNEKGCAKLGYSREEFLSLRVSDIDPNMDPSSYTEVVKELRKAGSWSMESLHLRKDRTTFPVEINLSYIQLDRDYIVIVVRDITERKRAEEERDRFRGQLLQSQKMEAIGILAGGVAHDFNNLLTTIIGNAHIALADLRKDDPLYEDIEDIKRAGERGAGLTRQLLAFSRKQIIQPEILDLNELLTGTEKMIGRLIGEDIELLTIQEPELWQVEADSGQMEQVIMNLVINARDAMPKGGKLTIETANVDLDEDYFHKHGLEEQTGTYVMMTVSDTGIGMDKETQERLFEPFFTTKGIGKGTGLGLSTVYGIVKQSGGYIWCYSEPGQGSTFKVYLPRAKGDVASEKEKRNPVTELGGSETVLIVEDDDSLRKLARNILKEKGYKVLEAKNGEAALGVSEAHDGPIDLMITDVVMPKMGGKEVAERLQALYPHMKVIYMSGYTDGAIVNHGVLAPGVNFIEKPFTPERLARKVREVLWKRELNIEE